MIANLKIALKYGENIEIPACSSENVSFFKKKNWRLRRRKRVTCLNFSAPSAPKTCYLWILGTLPLARDPIKEWFYQIRIGFDKNYETRDTGGRLLLLMLPTFQGDVVISTHQNFMLKLHF